MKTLRILVFSFLSVTLLKCSLNEDIYIEKSSDWERSTVSIEGDAKLKSLLSESLPSSTNGRIESQFGVLNTETILKIENDSIARYSFKFEDEDPSQFSNLIVTETETESSAYIISYLPNLDWLFEQSSLSQSWTDFTGDIHYFDTDGNQRGYSCMQNGITIEKSDEGNDDGRLEDFVVQCYTIVWTINTWAGGQLINTYQDVQTTCESTYVGSGNFNLGGGSNTGSGNTSTPIHRTVDCYDSVGDPCDSSINSTPVNTGKGDTSCPIGTIKNIFGECSAFSFDIFDPNCEKLGSFHGEDAASSWDFYNEYKNVSIEVIKNERSPTSFTSLDSQPGGPSIRYITDPLNPNLVIDMRHLIIIGELGRGVGESNEFFQYLAKKESAFDEQDYYSNELGYSFWQIYGPAVNSNKNGFADYFITFINDPENRNAISSPNKCK